MSRQIRISIEDDEVFERLKRRKDALDLSWEDALRRGLRDGPEPGRGPPAPPELPGGGHGRGSGPSGDSDRSGGREERHHGHREGRRRSRPERNDPSPFDPDFGQHIAREVLSSVSESVPGIADVALDDEIDRLEEAEDAVLVLGESEGERVPLRVELHTGPEGLEVDVVAVRSGKGTEEMNRFQDGTRADVARRFARGESATLELDGGDETYDVRPELTWARGPDGSPTVTEVSIRAVVFED